MKLTNNQKWILAALSVPTLCLCLLALYFVPPVHDRLAWRVEEARLRLQYSLHPPARDVFVPQQGQPAGLVVQPAVTVIVGGAGDASTPVPPAATPSPAAVTAAPTLLPELQAQLAATAAAQAADPAAASPAAPTAPPALLTPTATLPPLPSSARVPGIKYEDQHTGTNNCAPANLSMMLTFWGWEGSRDVIAPVLKPLGRDKNVMPYEMVDAVNATTPYRALTRIGGDLEVIKRFIANGYPVLLEKGIYLRDLSGVVSWMGHYQVVNAYDDASSTFITQDSYIEPDHEVSYADMIENWRAFNYTYILVYPPEQETQVLALLGADADETANAQNAALKASNEIYGLSGIDQYFAWFNRGSSLAALDDYMGAGAAYDEAFKVYPTLPEKDRPWRMLWYQTGPYFAYYYSQRYYDLLYLADGTLAAMQSDKNLEESYYWRGMARAALGDTAAAIEDFKLALQFHPGFGPALYQLQVMGVQP
ncbi:MAG: C39 family peptidase [Chloroflexota bacterium]